MFFCTKPMSAGRRLQDNVWGFPSLTLYGLLPSAPDPVLAIFKLYELGKYVNI